MFVIELIGARKFGAKDKSLFFNVFEFSWY